MSRNKPKSEVRTAKRRKSSSTRWLKRQLNDPYIERAKKDGYRSRAAYKLKEIDDKLEFLKPGLKVVDLGAAPGGWSQIAANKGCRIVALDLLAMDEIPGVTFLQLDFMDDSAPATLKNILNGPVDIVLSDMAPNTMGHKQTDHLRIMAVVEAAYEFAREVLKPGGVFVAKVFQGGAQNTVLSQMKKDFVTVRHIKPPASRKESAEQYVVATGFRAAIREERPLLDEESGDGA
ncbi:MAG: RlmE family RNA methyltransferase [Alphaproteobacteria bacterium]|nr:RlmE family RNA methyltransferase [Alphaproteobacteria bacterium]